MTPIIVKASGTYRCDSIALQAKGNADMKSPTARSAQNSLASRQGLSATISAGRAASGADGSSSPTPMSNPSNRIAPSSSDRSSVMSNNGIQKAESVAERPMEAARAAIMT